MQEQSEVSGSPPWSTGPPGIGWEKGESSEKAAEELAAPGDTGDSGVPSACPQQDRDVALPECGDGESGNAGGHTGIQTGIWLGLTGNILSWKGPTGIIQLGTPRNSPHG